MYKGLLHLHNLLRWVVLIALLVAIIRLVLKKDALKASKVLLISVHTTLVLGLYQYFSGPVGFKLIQTTGMKLAMATDAVRFWAIEHISGMLLAIILITIGHIKYKKGSSKTTLFLYIIALILILALIPWPFRAEIARPLYPGA